MKKINSRYKKTCQDFMVKSKKNKLSLFTDKSPFPYTLFGTDIPESETCFNTELDSFILYKQCSYI